MFWVSLLLESGSSDRDIAINTAKGPLFARGVLLQGWWLGRGGQVDRGPTPLQNTLPTQTPVPPCHNNEAHCLPTVLIKHFPFPEEWQCYGCIGLDLCCPDPEIKCHGMPWVPRLHPLLLQSSVLISTRNSPQSLLSLWVLTLLGSELTVRTTNKHLPKPVCFTLLIHTWPRMPSHVDHLRWTRDCQAICDLVLRSLLKRVVPPPTGCLPLQYPVSCVFFASL